MQIGEILDRGQSQEYDSLIESIEGQVPDDLQGTTLRNGPGVLQIGDDRVAYVDGLSAIGGVEFGHGTPYFRSRFARTTLYEEEMAAGRMVRRRAFTNLPRRWSNLLNVNVGIPGNHDIYHWNDRIYLGDVGNYAVDPRTFDVIGPETWNGAVGKRDQTAAMPRPDHHAGRLTAYTVSAGAKQIVRMLELDAELQVNNRREAQIYGFVHDQIATEHYLLVIDNPARASVAKILWGKERIFPSFAWPEELSPQLLLVRRDRDEVIRVALPRVRSVFHFINAYEQDGTLIVDVVGNMGLIYYDALYPAAERPAKVRPGPRIELLRYTIDLSSGAPAPPQCRPLCDLGGDMPEVDEAVHGRPYRYAWVVGLPGHDSDPYNLFLSDRITRVDVTDGSIDEWRAGPGHMVSQPAFVRRAGSEEEGDGYLTTWVNDYEHERTSVVVLDARTPSEGPLCTLDLGAYLPPASHCRFAPDLRIR